MRAFFADTRPGRIVTVEGTQFELPVLYYRDDSFAGSFTADLQKVRDLMPSDRLYPVTTVNGRAIIVVIAYDYLATSIGPYGEVGIVVPVVHGRRPPALVPALLESHWPGFGYLVLHLPVTTRNSRDGGRAQWGYTKFVADMDFDNTPEELACRLDEGGEHILTLRIEKRGVVVPDQRPVITYSVSERALLRTRIAQKTLVRTAFGAGASSLELGDVHPVARSLRALDIDPRPFQTRHYLDRSAILPPGQLVERNVRPLDGFFGQDRDQGILHTPLWH